MATHPIKRTSKDGDSTHFKGGIGESYGRIFDFDINGWELKKNQTDWLDINVVPYLIAGGSATLEAMTSSHGSLDWNQELSEKRLAEVKDYLSKHAPGRWALRSSVASGKTKATKALGDNVENAFWRAVDVTAWFRPQPPPEKKQPPEETLFKNRIYRTNFVSLSSKSKGAGPPGSDPFDGNTVLLNAVLDAIKALLPASFTAPVNEGELKASREMASYPVSYEVNRVFLEVHDYTWESPITGAQSHGVFTEATYVWGPPSHVVLVDEHTVYTTSEISLPGIPPATNTFSTTEQRVITRAEARKNPMYNPRD